MQAWDSVESREVAPGFRARVIPSATMTFTMWDVTKDAPLPEHSHPQEQVTQMLEGEFELVVDGKPHHLKPGDVLIVPSNVVHGGRALTDCRILDSLFPRRDNYVFPTEF